jgi:hypothetical protein
MLAVVLFAACPADRLTAQDSTRVASPDTSHRVSPGGAFRRSLLFPGWGQAATGRHTTGALFIAWEGTTMMMTLKARQEANYMQRIGASGLKLKRQEVQDWMVLWIFNHLFAGAEAYVSAHLQGFPKDLHVQSVPGGIGISVPLRRP